MTVLCNHDRDLLSCNVCVGSLMGPPTSVIRHQVLGTFRVCEYEDGHASAKCLACSTAWRADNWHEAVEIAEMGCAC